jgi:hypothetical protein
MRSRAPLTVWVLSEESPFDDPQESGGCVCGVFATAAAALFDLGTWDIGPEALGQITWTAQGNNIYEGVGYGKSIYILRAHLVQEERDLRAEVAIYDERYRLRSHPLSAWSTAELLALLVTPGPHEALSGLRWEDEPHG